MKMTVETLMSTLDYMADSTHSERVDHLAATLKSYMPAFQEAVQNASPTISAKLAQEYDAAGSFLNAWKQHAADRPVTTEEFNDLRKLYHVVDDALQTHGPVSIRTGALTMAAFAAIGK